MYSKDRREGWRTLAKSLFVLGKPRVSMLLFITSLTTFIFAHAKAQGTIPEARSLLAFTIAGLLAPMGANALNNYLDRDIDPLMRRTRERPIPRGIVSPRVALLLGVMMLSVSGVLFALAFNLLSALLAVAGGLYYVIVYTIILKRRTPWSTVVGGLAGSFPPLVGWVAGAGGVGVTGVLLALVIFFWNPPHFWALAMHLREDYRKAGLPMMPVIAGASASLIYMIVFTIFTFITMAGVAWVEDSMLLWGATIIAGALLLRAMHVIYSRGVSGALKAFKLSNPALGIFFLALVAEALL